jgi:hypothetical protein
MPVPPIAAHTAQKEESKPFVPSVTPLREEKAVPIIKTAPVAKAAPEPEPTTLEPAEKPEPTAPVVAAPTPVPHQPTATFAEPLQTNLADHPAPALPVEEVVAPAEPAALLEPKEESRAPTAEDEELRIQVKVGVGAKRVSLEQTGAQGGVKGSIAPMGAFSMEAGASLGPWHVRAGVEKYSGDFATDRTNARLKEKEEFRSFSLKPGYGIFHLGVASKTAPTVRVSGASLIWEEASALYALAGVRLEKAYLKRKPYWLGVELEGSYPLGVSGEGSTDLSSPGGFGLSLRGYAEKEILPGEVMNLKLGLEGNAGYEKFDWNGSSGACSRTMQELGARLYIGMEF